MQNNTNETISVHYSFSLKSIFSERVLNFYNLNTQFLDNIKSSYFSTNQTIIIIIMITTCLHLY